MTYLYAAYAATWIIHLIYAGTLISRSRRLKKERKGLQN
jgi:CcmD family protein